MTWSGFLIYLSEQIVAKMRFKWFFVAILCLTLLQSALVVRAQHENEEDDEGLVDNGDLIEAGDEDSPIAPPDDAVVDNEEEPPPPEDPVILEEEEEQQDEINKDIEQVEEEDGTAPNQDVDVDVPTRGKNPLLGSRRSGNYYFDEDYYAGNYDVDINYDWSELQYFMRKGIF